VKEYTTVLNRANDEFEERKSRFIGYACPVKTADEAMAFISEIKNMHKQATHNVWCYNLKNGERRYSDDGEPQGTAGIPSLDVLLKADVVDVAVVVTRYFGGILLGGGGLVRAYSHATTLAINAAEVITMSPCVVYSLTCDYTLYGKLNYALPKLEAKVLNTLFLEDITLTVRLPEDKADDFLKEIIALSNGTVEPQEQKREFCRL
jgi:uncharacterized YigZ family protein